MEKINLEQLSEKEFVILMNTLSSKVRDKIERTCKYLNDILAPYGLEIYLLSKVVKKEEISNLISKEDKLNFLLSSESEYIVKKNNKLNKNNRKGRG